MSNPQSGRQDFRFDPLPAIEGMEDFFRVTELVNRTIEGGWELLFRNRLLRNLRAGQSSDCVESYGREVVVFPGTPKNGDGSAVAGKIADIAAFASDRLNPSAIIEIKHNFATQSQVFTSLLEDVRKWSDWKKSAPGRQCEFHFIQIVTDVTRLRERSSQRGDSIERQSAENSEFSVEVCKDIFKYGIQPKESEREGRRDQIIKRLSEIQKRVDGDISAAVREFKVSSDRYFDQDVDYRAEVRVFVVSQRAGVYVNDIDREFPKPEGQGSLLRQEKG